jgi:2-oxoglutarate decarboxylase
MAHRGRLNVLINIVGKSYGELFEEFEGNIDPGHRARLGRRQVPQGFPGQVHRAVRATIDVVLSSNPSHLEAVDPVVEGMARAKQDQLDKELGGGAHPVLPLLIHGDAAFAGQGVVAETLNLSALPGYETGGTVHLVINNQLGFTTNPESARSSVYATDVAKMVQAPIFHVNGDDPEACVRVGRLAFAFRQAFHKDVVIDMVCYRRFGHNEQDDPSLTQPLLYQLIKEHRSVRKLYTETLVRRGDITIDEAEEALQDFSRRLQAALDETRAAAPQRRACCLRRRRRRRCCPRSRRAWLATVLQQVVDALSTFPEGFHRAPEAAAGVRDPGQAVGRRRGRLGPGRGPGLRDPAPRGPRRAPGRPGHPAGDLRAPQRRARRLPHRGEEYVPLAAPSVTGAVLDLRLAAVGVRGRRLRIRLLAGGTRRPGGVGGPVRRLRQRRPDHHRPVPGRGRDQVGPDVGSDPAAAARLRRAGGGALLGPHRAVLDLCAEDNMQVADVTTAAQLFHLLRRQVLRSTRKPLILFTPKRYLRGREAYSPAAEFAAGISARSSTTPGVADRDAVRRVVLATGKVALDDGARDKVGPNGRGGGPGRAALPVAGRSDRRRSWPRYERADRSGVVAGGAREHGRVELRPGPPRRSVGLRLPSGSTAATCRPGAGWRSGSPRDVDGKSRDACTTYGAGRPQTVLVSRGGRVGVAILVGTARPRRRTSSPSTQWSDSG